MNQQQDEKRIRNRPSAPQLKPEYGKDWSVSFKYLDGRTAWSDESRSVPHLILFWLASLAQSRDHGQLLDFKLPHIDSPIHHSISFDSLTTKGQSRIAQLSDNRDYVDLGLEDLFSLRYCHKSHSPQRLIGVFRGLVFYPIWWDPKHQYSGAPKERIVSGDCKSAECLHLIDY